jgi:hypothetical protein
MIVVDVTVLAPFLLHTSAFPLAVRVSNKKDPLWIVPREWRMELLGELVMHVREGHSSIRQAHTLVIGRPDADPGIT